MNLYANFFAVYLFTARLLCLLSLEMAMKLFSFIRYFQDKRLNVEGKS